jgi:hypothetical protein
VYLASSTNGEIFQMWKKHYDIHTQIELMNSRLQTNLKFEDASNYKTSYFYKKNSSENSSAVDSVRNFYARILLADVKFITFSEANPVSFSSMKIPFFMCLMLQLACISSFMMESVVYRMNLIGEYF